MYGKHFERMYQGSMRGAGADVFAVWGYVISHAKSDSVVELNPEVVAFLIGMPQERVEKAIRFLMSPDSKSRNKEYEGRRMVKRGEFEYFLPSVAYYRGVSSMEDLREYNRVKQRESRERRKLSEPKSESLNGDSNGPDWDSVEKWRKTTVSQGSDYSDKETKSAFLSLKANGWMWGRNPVVDWKSAIERQIQTDRDRKQKSNNNPREITPSESLPMKELERLKREVDRL